MLKGTIVKIEKYEGKEMVIENNYDGEWSRFKHIPKITKIVGEVTDVDNGVVTIDVCYPKYHSSIKCNIADVKKVF